MVCNLTGKYKDLPEEERHQFCDDSFRETVGKCPPRKAAVYEGKSNYYCSNRDCNFVLWKESKWLSGMHKKVNKKMAQALLSDGKVFVTGLYSRL